MGGRREVGIQYLKTCDQEPDLIKLIKVASNTRQCLKLGGTTLYGMEEGGRYSVKTRSDLKQKKVIFFVGVSRQFCNWLSESFIRL